MRKWIGTTALALAAAAAACESSTAPVEPVDTDAAALVAIDAAAGVMDGTSALRGGANLLDRLAAAIPGFGGLYFSGCDLVVVLTERASADHATKVVAPLLRRHLARVGRRCADGGAVVIQRGEFTWQELNRFLGALRPVARLRGVGRIAISIPHNRILIQVANRAVAEHVIAALERLGVPVRAVEF